MGCGFSSGGGSDKDGGSGGTNSDEGERTGTAKSGIATDGAGDARTDAGQSGEVAGKGRYNFDQSISAKERIKCGSLIGP